MIYFLVNLTSVSSVSSSAKKRSAPNAPAGSAQQQPIYGTLPHSVGRYQQSYDLSDIYNTSNNISTLPHPPRNSLTQNINNSNNNTVAGNQQQQHFDNKVYERFEPYMMQASKASHKRSPSSDSITRSINLGEFGKVLIASSEVLIGSTVAGAKLVLPPAGEIPQLKPVNINRPRMPPPPGPPNGSFEYFN